MGINGSSAGSSFARQGGASVTCNIEALLAPVSDAPIIVPIIQAAPNIPKVVLHFDERSYIAGCIVKLIAEILFF